MKFKSPEPRPTPFQAESLEILIEECAEVSQRATKILRFGLEEVQSGQDLTNKERLSQEVGDVLAMVDHLSRHGLLSPLYVGKGHQQKTEKLKIYMQTEADDV